LVFGKRIFSCAVVIFVGSLAFNESTSPETPPPDQNTIIRQIDAAVLARVNSISGYTVTEHYAVFRGDDESHSVADMTVKTTYRKDSGKSYDIISEGGSSVIRRLGLDPILQSEMEINLPDHVAQSWIVSANYDMMLRSGIQKLDGRDCYVVAISPKRKAPNLIVGSIWVDAKDFTIVRLEGIASKAPSVFAGATHMMRQYTNVGGFSMATHARAESSTFVYGKTIVTIDYSGYNIQLNPGS
jgi:outer membrane lipoprotein-sorting protein